MASCSGQSVSALGGLDVLRELLRRSREKGGPAILPGAGINPGTICHVLENLLPHGLKEVHMSGGRWVEGRMDHRREGMGMGASVEQEWNIWSTDGNAIGKVRSVVDDAETSASCSFNFVWVFLLCSLLTDTDTYKAR